LDDQTEVRLLREQMLRASGYADYLYYRKKYEHALAELRVKHLYQQNRLDWVTRQDMPQRSGTQSTEDTTLRVQSGGGASMTTYITHRNINYDTRIEQPRVPPPVPQYGQGMTRGYWRGGIVGRHPGYRAR
jgi:hypothetical protein